MSWFRKSKNTVTVEFIENGTEDPFAVSEVPIEQLPNTFELETNLEIGQQNWLVVQAIPNQKDEFIKTGKLKVFLNKVQEINPNEILFSLPTINDSLFETEVAASENIFSIHEDDWRQLEFVSKNFSSKVVQEIKSVFEIYEGHKVGIGFDQVHIRRLIEQPLDSKNITLEDLLNNFDVIEKYDGFGVGNNKAKNSFAFRVAEETIFYGQLNNNRIIYFCINRNENSSQFIEKIVRKYEIIFVDWCKAEIVE